MSQSPQPSKTEVITWLGGFAVVFIWSAIAPKDLFTWFLEVVPALAALVAMARLCLGHPKRHAAGHDRCHDGSINLRTRAG